MTTKEPLPCTPDSPECANLRRQWTEFCAARGTPVQAACAPGWSRVCALLSALRFYSVRDTGAITPEPPP